MGLLVFLFASPIGSEEREDEKYLRDWGGFADLIDCMNGQKMATSMFCLDLLSCSCTAHTGV